MQMVGKVTCGCTRQVNYIIFFPINMVWINLIVLIKSKYRLQLSIVQGDTVKPSYVAVLVNLNPELEHS